MATLIGLCIRVKLLRVLPSRFKVDIQVWFVVAAHPWDVVPHICIALRMGYAT
jgi:hypothetical protein